MPKNKRAARKKKKKNIKSSVSNPLAEKLVAEAEAVSNPGEKFSPDPTAMANSVLSGRVVNGDQMSLPSALEGLSLRQQVHPLHKHLNERTTIPHAGAEKTAADAKLSDEVILQESLIKTSKKAGRTEQLESVDNDKSVTGSTSDETEKNELPILVDRLNFLQESLIKSTLNETEGNEAGNVGKSSYHPTAMANLVESDIADGDQISHEGALESVSSMTPSSTIPPAVETNEASGSVVTDEVVLEETIAETVIEEPSVELPRRSQRNTNLPSHFSGFYMSPPVKPKRA